MDKCKTLNYIRHTIWMIAYTASGNNRLQTKPHHLQIKHRKLLILKEIRKILIADFL